MSAEAIGRAREAYEIASSVVERAPRLSAQWRHAADRLERDAGTGHMLGKAEALQECADAYDARHPTDATAALAREIRIAALRLVASEEAHGIHEALAIAAHELAANVFVAHTEAAKTSYVTPAMARAELEAGK